MNDTQLQELEKISDLQTAFTGLYILDGDTFKARTKTKNIYDSTYNTRLEEFKKGLNSVGIDSKLTPKQIELKLQQKYEDAYKLLKKVPKFAEADRPNDVPTSVTLTPQQLADLAEKKEKIDQQNKDIRTREKQAVEDFTKNGKSIYEEQQKIQEQIKKAQEIQPELKSKALYAQVVLTKEQILSKQEESDLNTLREIANLSQDSRAKLVDDLSEKIVEKIRPVMTGATDEEIITVSRSVAVDITEKISTPESRYEIPTQIAILNNLPQAPETGSIIRKPSVIQELEKGSIVLAQHKKAVMETNESITKSLLGNSIAKVLYGDSPIQVIFSDKFIPNKTTHTIQLEGVNQDSLSMMRLQDSFLTTLREKGIDHIREVGIGQTRTFINNQVEKAINKLPKESALRTIYSSETVNLILNRNQLIQQPIFMNTGNIIGSVALRVAPKYAPILTAIGGGSYAAVAASSYAASYVTIQTTAGIFAAEAFAGGAGGALAGASAGSIVPIVGTAIGAVVGYIGGEVLSKVASRIKVWWTENKDQAGPAIAVGLGFGGLVLGGPAAGGITLGLGLAATGSLAAFATGAFGVLGLIGRSVGIAIATPVIVTLLVLPPLVAFIMLVINNSAYVVPPSPLSSTSSNPYIEVTKVADPAGPFENSDLPLDITYTVTIKAKRENLTNVKITDTCRIIQEASTIPCGSPEIEVPKSISPSSPFTFTYSNTYNTFTVDALVINTIEVIADTQDSPNESTIGSASITIGTPPSSCLEPSGDWPPDKWALVENTLDTIRSKYPGYLTKVCDGHPNGIPVVYNRAGSANYWGYWSDPTMTLYPLGLENERTALYVLSHELLHALMSSKYYSLFKEYESIAGIFSETPRCFYSYSPSLTEERLGEAVAFSIMPNQSCSLGGNSSMNNWPKHRDFVLQKILR